MLKTRININLLFYKKKNGLIMPDDSCLHVIGLLCIVTRQRIEQGRVEMMIMMMVIIL